MRKRRSTDIDWLQEKIKLLVNASEKLKNISSDIHYTGHAWSVVKLLILGGWSYVYTTIISNYWKHGYWYIDLLSGPGTSIVKERRDVVIGSPFVPHFFAKREYTKYIFIEKKNIYYEALSKRAKVILNDKAVVYHGDSNKISPIVAQMAFKNKIHFLAFIDNEGLDIKWSTIASLLKTRCDILINFPTSEIKRVKGAALKDDKVGRRNAEALTKFYGGEEWKSARNTDDLLKIYMYKIRKHYREIWGKEPYVSSIRVGAKQFYYDMVLITKMGPYVKAWEYLHDKFKEMQKNTDLVVYSLDFLTGRTKSIDWFIGLQEKIEEKDVTLDKWVLNQKPLEK